MDWVEVVRAMVIRLRMTSRHTLSVTHELLVAGAIAANPSSRNALLAFDPRANGICFEHRAVQEHPRELPSSSCGRRRRAGRLCLAGCRHRSRSAFDSGRHQLPGASGEFCSSRGSGAPRGRPNPYRGCFASTSALWRNRLRSGSPSGARSIRNRRSRVTRTDPVRPVPGITRTRPSTRHLNRHS
jgi:hypothetical protein